MAAFRLALGSATLHLPTQQVPFSQFEILASPAALHPRPRLVDVLILAQRSSKHSTVQEDEALVRQIQVHRQLHPTLFLILWHERATEDAFLRWGASIAGASMVTCSMSHLAEALTRVTQQTLGVTDESGSPSIMCLWCGMSGLTPLTYHLHQPLYHVNEPNLQGTCQVCKHNTQNIARHLHETHMPPGRQREERTGVFALAVVRRPSDGRFLLTQEFAREGFWLPGGGVNPGESLSEGAIREAQEEAGVDISLKGLLSVEVHPERRWRRVIFYAEPVDEGQTPKTVPDFDGAGACWVDAEQVKHLPLRSPSELSLVLHVAAGGDIHPLEMPAKYAQHFADWRF